MGTESVNKQTNMWGRTKTGRNKQTGWGQCVTKQTAIWDKGRKSAFLQLSIEIDVYQAFKILSKIMLYVNHMQIKYKV